MAKQFTYQTKIPRTQHWLTLSGVAVLSAIAIIWGVILVNQYLQDKQLRKQYGAVAAGLYENNHLKNLDGEKRVVSIQQEIDTNKVPSNDDYAFLANILTGPNDADAQADAIIALDLAVDNGLMSLPEKRYIAFATVSVLHSPDDRLRTKECSLLGKLNTTAIIPELVPLQNDPDQTVRYFAQKALASLGHKSN